MPQLAGKQLENWHPGPASGLGAENGPAAKLGTPTVRQVPGSRWVPGRTPHRLPRAVLSDSTPGSQGNGGSPTFPDTSGP